MTSVEALIILSLDFAPLQFSPEGHPSSSHDGHNAGSIRSHLSILSLLLFIPFFLIMFSALLQHKCGMLITIDRTTILIYPPERD